MSLNNLSLKTRFESEDTIEAPARPERRKNTIWLPAWSDPVAHLKTYPSCVRLVDLFGDGEDKLLVADQDRKLKVFKGTCMLSEHALLDFPCAIASFYSDLNAPHVPAVAVGSGSFVFIYRNLRPYYKFVLPQVELSQAEVSVWAGFATPVSSNPNEKAKPLTVEAGVQMLTEARDSGQFLSTRSMELLCCDNKEEFVEAHKQLPLIQHSFVTCMDTLFKCSNDPKSVSMAVIGTEHGDVLIMEPTGTAIHKKISLASAGVPVFISCYGLLDVDYRIVVACRNGNVYSIKNGKLQGGVIELETQPCGLVNIDKSIIVGCMDNTIYSFHIKGKKNYCIYLPAAILCMTTLELVHSKNLTCLLVSLANGEIRLYNGKDLISTTKVEDPVVALRFGAYGREENTLVCVHSRGGLSMNILSRTATLDTSLSTPIPSGPPIEQDIPLNIPKKTRLYIEQTEYEKENSLEMHRTFQRDLCKLRLTSARSYAKCITDGIGPVSVGSTIRLNAKATGLGPLFHLELDLRNTGLKPINNIPVCISSSFYNVSPAVLLIPVLLPGVPYQYTIDIFAPKNGQDSVRIFLTRPGTVVPLLSAVVKMPIYEEIL